MRNLTPVLVLCFISIASKATVYWDDTFNCTDFLTTQISGWLTTTTKSPTTATRTLQIPALTYIISTSAFVNSGLGNTLNNYYKGVSTPTASSFVSYKPINSGSSVSAQLYLSFLYKVQA